MAVTTSSGNGFALYNGIKLPNIDSVWANKETYLYAFVTYTVLSTDGAMYDVRFATTEYGYNGSRFYPVNNGTYVSFTTPANQATVDWINANGGNVSLGVWRESGSGSLVASRAIKLDMRWHSFDIEGFGDATFPIPLDGMNVIEWDGVTDGNSIEIQAGYSIQRIGDYLPTDIYGGFVTSNSAADSNPITIYGSPSGSYSSIPDSYTAEASIFENDSWLVSYIGDELDYSVNALLSVKGNLPMTASVTVSEGLWVPVIGVNGSIAMYTPLVAYRTASDESNEPIITESSGDGFELYNGVKLPKLDDIWTDKSNHVFICKADNSYFAIVSTVAPYQDSANGGVSLSAPFYFRQYGCFTDEATANQYGTTAYTWTLYQEHSLEEGVSNFKQTVIWTSTDIRKDSDGSMFLATSEPIPLDGMWVIEWNGGTEGLPELSDVGFPNMYQISSQYINLSDGDPYICAIWNGSEHIVYPHAVPLIYELQDLGGESYWYLSGVKGATPFVVSASVPSYSLVGTAFMYIGEGLRTTLFAYRVATDLKPVYKRIGSTWVKQTAYNKLSGEWVLISTS